MSTTLIAVLTCRTRSEWAEIIRKTWAPLCSPKADVKYFVGRGATQDYAVHLDCDDSYQGLPGKVREIVRYALQFGYEHVLKCDDDVVLDVKKLLESGYEKYDFSGHESSPGSSVPYGFNYWLSKKAMEVLAERPLPTNNNDEAWVAHALYEKDIHLHHDPRYRLYMGPYKSWIDDRRPLRKNSNAKNVVLKQFAWCLHNKTVPLEASLAEFETLHRATQET